MALKLWKAAYDAKLWKLLKEYRQILVVAADNVGSKHLQNIRRDLHADSVMVMGRNTMMRRSIKLDADSTGNKAFLNLVPLLVGNVGLIFTKADLKELSEKVAEYEVIRPHLMCPKFLSYDSYRNCFFMRSRQLPLSLACCQQLFPQTANPLLLCPRFLPFHNCFLTRSRQFLIMSVSFGLYIMKWNNHLVAVSRMTFSDLLEFCLDKNFIILVYYQSSFDFLLCGNKL